MPLRKLLSNSELSADDIAFLETLYNQCVGRDWTEEERYKFAHALVDLFTSGVRSEAELIQRLVDRVPSVEHH